MLVLGGSEHQAFHGDRVKLEEGEAEIMKAEFRRALDTELKVDQCVLCNRKGLKEGDFGLEHLFFVEEGDPDKKVAKVRSLPRMWCYPCSVKFAKENHRPRVQTKTVRNLREVWEMKQEQITQPLGEQQPAEQSGEKLTKNQKEKRRKRIKERRKLMETAFIIVEKVHEDSPASKCGLEDGDKICQFADLTSTTYVDVATSIVPIVQASVDKDVKVCILRPTGEKSKDDGEELHKSMEMSLTPKKWSGGGLLGCVLNNYRYVYPE